MKFVPVYTIKIIFTSGASQIFDVLEFTFTSDTISKTVRWKVLKGNGIKPLILTPDAIAAVFILRTRRKLVWRSKSLDQD